MTEERCINCGRRVPWFSFTGNFVLAVFKVLVGFLGGSAALIADGLHSFTDVVGTSAIIASIKVSERPADKIHPYGYGKAEFVGSAFIYGVLMVLAITIAFGALIVIFGGEIKAPRFVTLLGAGVSALYNILMYGLGECAGKRNNSPALLANSFENRADGISSIAVIIGIGMAMFVHPICDPIAALVVGIIIFVNSVEQLNESLGGLMDKSLPREVVARIQYVAAAQNGVVGVEYVKTRQVGTRYWVDVGITVASALDVETANTVAATVRGELLSRSQRMEELAVFIYAAPEVQPPATQRPRRGVWWGSRKTEGIGEA